MMKPRVLAHLVVVGLASILCYSGFLYAGTETSPSGSTNPAPKTEKSYEGSVLLVDAQTGSIGIQIAADDKSADQKTAFKVDPKNVYVTNPMNQELAFSDIQPGDDVDIYVLVDAAGNETVDEIIDYNRVARE